MDAEISIKPFTATVESSSSGRVSILVGLLLVATLGLLPAYLLPSGGYQVVDFPLFLLIVITIFANLGKSQLFGQVYYLLPFLFWATFIDTGYAVIYSDKEFLLLGLVPLIYGALIIVALSMIFGRIITSRKIIYIYLGLVLSIIVTLTTRGVPIPGMRALLSFNDPNQLGYFAVILLCYAIILINYKNNFNHNNFGYFIVDAILIVFAHYFMALSVSRSAMAGIFVLDVCLLKNIRNIKIFATVLLFMIISIVILTFWKPNFIKERLAVRDPGVYSEGAISGSFEERAMSPLNLLHGIQFIIGRGQGSVASFRNLSASGIFANIEGYGGESHNAIIEIFCSYGCIGLALFLFWLLPAIWSSRILKDGPWIWGGLLAFNMGNYGLRWRAMWIVLAFLLAMVSQVKIQKAETSVVLRK
jgi:hypothetical protein